MKIEELPLPDFTTKDSRVLYEKLNDVIRELNRRQEEQPQKKTK